MAKINTYKRQTRINKTLPDQIGKKLAKLLPKSVGEETWKC